MRNIDLPLAARDTLTFASLSAGCASGTTTSNGTFNGIFQVFAAGSYNINSTSFGQTSTTAVGARVIQLRGYIRW